MQPPSPTATIAEFIVSTDPADVPEAAIEAAKFIILDGFANLAAGSNQDSARLLRATLVALGGSQDATIAGAAVRCPTPTAALANGFSLHCLDYEVQGHPSAHGTSSLLPAVAAVAEQRGLSGREVLGAFVVGWDVQQRLRAAGEEGPMRGFHPPGVLGPIAAAAAVANLQRLDVGTTRRALGLAASAAGGLFANNGTMAKALHPGYAARSGVESVLFASAGMTSCPTILEEHRGFNDAVFGGVFDGALFTADLGSRFHIVDPGFMVKHYPSEIYMQWAIEVVVELRRLHDLRAEDVREIVIEPPVFRPDLSRAEPESGLDGKFSYEYSAAIALTEDRVGIGSFSDQVRFSPRVIETLAKVRLQENRDIPKNKLRTWARATAHLVDGREVTHTCERFVGAIGRPMTPEQHDEKVLDCFRNSDFLSVHQQLRELLTDLENVDDFGHVMRLMRTDQVPDA